MTKPFMIMSSMNLTLSFCSACFIVSFSVSLARDMASRTISFSSTRSTRSQAMA